MAYTAGEYGGAQALERTAPVLPLRPGVPESAATIMSGAAHHPVRRPGGRHQQDHRRITRQAIRCGSFTSSKTSSPRSKPSSMAGTTAAASSPGPRPPTSYSRTDAAVKNVVHATSARFLADKSYATFPLERHGVPLRRSHSSDCETRLSAHRSAAGCHQR